MRILSESQFSAWSDLTLAPIEEIREGIWAVPLPLPVPGLPWVFSYFILDSNGQLNVVDSGWDSEESWGAFVAAVAAVGKRLGDVRSLTVTHFHPDHLGMAERIREVTGARVALLEREQETLHSLVDPDALQQSHDRDMAEWGVPAELWPQLHAPQATGAAIGSFDADVVLSDGDLLDVPGREIRALATPGHTIGELSLHDAEAGILYSGDHLLPNQFPGIGLGGQGPTNPIADYLASLDRVAALGDLEVDPGHGYRFSGLQERCETTRRHHLARSQEIASILEALGSPTVWEVASRVSWTSGWENLLAVERLSALGQTALHIDYLSRSAEPVS